jgi:hypothetical protein
MAAAWLRARARLLPNLLPQSPPWVREVFDNAWAPMTALQRQLAALPAGLWEPLMACEGGYLAVCHGPSRYEPGPAQLLTLPLKVERPRYGAEGAETLANRWEAARPLWVSNGCTGTGLPQ